jgi:hypothetical protein
MTMPGRARAAIAGALLFGALACGGGDDPAGPDQPAADQDGRVKAGVWEGKITSGWPGTLSFRVVSESSFTDLVIRVPVFGAEQSGCETSWTQSVAIGSDGAYAADLTNSSINTSLAISGTFSSQTVMTGSVVGACRGKLVLLGMQFSASWVRS